MASLPLACAVVSRKGRRPSNEDSALAEVPAGEGIAGFALVCDGMGGHNAGEVASAVTTDVLAARLRAAAHAPEPQDPEALVLEWVKEANRTVFARSETAVELKGMGTTAAVAFVTGGSRLVVANVGDSKIFLVRGPSVSQLSVDHTALAERRRALGEEEVSREEELASPFAHALTRSLGQEPRVVPDSRADLTLEEGDVVCVTSDGVTDVLESERFLRAIETSATLHEVAEEIYRLAFEAGSRDNISVALLARGRHERLGTSRGESARQTQPILPPPAAAPRSTSRGFLGAAAVAALLGVALAGYLAVGRRASTATSPPVPVGRATLLEARIERAPEGVSLRLVFREELKRAGELAARVSGVRVAGVDETAGPTAHPASCATRGRTLGCTLAADGALAAESGAALRPGEIVDVHVAGDGFAFDAAAVVR